MKPKPTLHWWGGIALLWLMLTPVVAAIYTLLLPIAPNDFWYNARAGRFIIETGQIPTVALFTTSLPAGTPYYYQSWLAQILLFKTLQIGGLSGVVLLRTFVLTATFGFVVLAAWRRVGSMNADAKNALSSTTLARFAALCALLSFALSASNMDVRPQTFSVFFFAIWTYCIFEWSRADSAKRGVITIVLSASMVLWANTHGAFFVGVILLAAFFGGEWLHFLGSRHNPKFSNCFGAPLEVAALKALGVAVVLSALVPLFNPRGAELYGYVFKLAGDKASQKFIQEWRSPNFSEWYGALFFVALLLVGLMMGVLLRRARSRALRDFNAPQSSGVLGARLGELTALATMAILALRDVRSIIWFAIFLAPVLASMMAQLFLLRAGEKPTNQQSVPPPGIQIANGFIALMLVSSCTLFLPAFKPRLGMPSEYSSHFAPTPQGAFPAGFSSDPPLLLDRDTPVEAVEFMKKHPPRGRLWNDMVFGSYLTWVGKPLEPFCDPRVEMYSLAFWNEYARLIEGPLDAADTLRSQGFTDALLHVKDEKPLLERLKKNGWQVVFKKGNAILLRDIKK